MSRRTDGRRDVVDRHAVLVRRGFALEWITLAWNVIGVVVLGYLGVLASSVALIGFGLDSLIEIGASAVVIWELSGVGVARQRRALQLIAGAFIALACYLLVQSVVALGTSHRAHPSPAGIVWTAVTAVVMFALAFGKRKVGRELDNVVLVTEGRVTLIDAILATSVLVGLVLDAVFGLWWADPVVGLVIVFYAAREALHILTDRSVGQDDDREGVVRDHE